MRALLAVLALAACNGDAQVTVRNAAPTATILWPAEGASTAPVALAMRGTASDPDDSASDLRATWRVDDGIACAPEPVADDDTTGCTATLTEGRHRIGLEVIDPDGASAGSSVEITVEAGDAPVLTVLSPEDGASRRVDTPLLLVVMATDAEDPPTALEIVWTSDVSGAVWTGTPDSTGRAEASVTLGVATHALTATARDTDGNESSRQIIVEMLPPNTAPGCEIRHPDADARYAVGDVVAFSAQVSDPDQPASSLLASWKSDTTGTFATSTPSGAGLATAESGAFAPGEQTVTLTVEDDDGAVCTDSVRFRVGDFPSAEILAPTTGSVVDEGDIVSFAGVVADPEDAAVDLAIRWRSDVDGVLWAFAADSTGATEWSTDTLSPGVHTITLETTDSDGLRATDVIALEVNGIPSAPEVSITPEPAYTDDDLVVRVDAISVDPEGTAVSYRYAWSVDGVPSAIVASRVDASLTHRGETWTTRVIPSDGRIEGTAGTASVTIGNTAPSIRAVSVSPEPLYAADIAECEVSGFADADADGDLTAYGWTIDGVEAGTSTTLTGFAKGETVTCTATPSDGVDDGAPLSYAVVVANTPPTVTGAVITPSEPKVGDTVTCAAAGFVDADGDGDDSRFAWTRDAVAVGTGATFPATFVGGDRLGCTVTPGDGEDDGAAVSNSVLVVNSAPTAASATITPDPAFVTDTLSCGIAGFSDPDGDGDLSTYAWRVGSAVAGTAATLATGFSAGDTVTCTITPSDGSAGGPTVSDSVVISNSPPKTSVPSLSPTTAYETSTLTCAAGATTDADGTTAFAFAYSWTVDGAALSTTATTLDGASFSKGDSVVCTVTASDGAASSEPRSSSSVTILDSAPTASVTLTPDPLFTDDLATTSVETADADGDAVSLSYRWTVAGVVAGTGTTLDGASAFNKGDLVEVTVTPSDGTATGVAATDSVTVSNTAPYAPEVSVQPLDPVEGEDDLWCRIDTAATDPDSDTVAYVFEWFVDAAPHTAVLSTVYPGDTVNGLDTAQRETWVCVASADDGADVGDEATASVRILGIPVDYGHLQFPCSASVAAGSAFTLYGWIYQPGVTPGAGSGPGITVEGGYGPDGSLPTASTWTWASGSYNGDKDGLSPGDQANDEYAVTFTAPAAGTWDFALRASTDGGLSWLYIDAGGYCGGSGTRDGYSAAMAGSLTTY